MEGRHELIILFSTPVYDRIYLDVIYDVSKPPVVVYTLPRYFS